MFPCMTTPLRFLKQIINVAEHSIFSESLEFHSRYSLLFPFFLRFVLVPYVFPLSLFFKVWGG